MLSEKTRDNGHEVKYGKFYLNTINIFFTLRVIQHWSGLPREVVESPFLEIFKT